VQFVVPMIRRCRPDWPVARVMAIQPHLRLKSLLLHKCHFHLTMSMTHRLCVRCEIAVGCRLLDDVLCRFTRHDTCM